MPTSFGRFVALAQHKEKDKTKYNALASLLYAFKGGLMMKIIQKLVISTFLVISISTLMINDIEAQSFDYEIIGYGIDGKREENIEIIDNKNDFETKWKRKISPDKLTTPIDFNKECIIAISRGQCGSGGHGIRIKNLYEESGYLIIEIVYTDPGESCRVTYALTYPYLVMRLKNRDLDIIFDRQVIIKE